jgi:hypothetical protein
VGIAIWQIIPPLVFVFAPQSLKSWFVDEAKANKMLQSPQVQEKWQQLHALGFDLLGVKAEKVPGQGSIYELSTVSLDAESYASVMLPRAGTPASVYFYTPLKGGGLVFTRAYAFAPEMETENTSVKNIASGNLDMALNSHGQRVQSRKQKGLMPMVEHSQAQRLAATDFYYATDYSKSTGQTLLKTTLLMSCGLWMVLGLLGFLVGITIYLVKVLGH